MRKLRLLFLASLAVLISSCANASASTPAMWHCFDEGWCSRMSPFVDQGKAVLAAEYTDTGARLATFCPKARNLGFDAILKKRNLGAWRRSC